MTDAIDIAANLALVQERMAAAARRAGRSPDEIMLLAVSKTHPVKLIEQALAAGQRDFGENLVEEAWAKFGDPDSPASLATHFDAAGRPRLHLIANRLDRFAAEANRVLDVLLEVNVAGETSKFGWTPDGVRQDAEAILALPHLRVAGLMTIPPYEPDPEAARPHFAALRRLQLELARRYAQADWRCLSMGMSHDFEVAIQEGATIVRVGTAIFGTRTP